MRAEAQDLQSWRSSETYLQLCTVRVVPVLEPTSDPDQVNLFVSNTQYRKSQLRESRQNFPDKVSLFYQLNNTANCRTGDTPVFSDHIYLLLSHAQFCKGQHREGRRTFLTRYTCFLQCKYNKGQHRHVKCFDKMNVFLSTAQYRTD